LKGKKKGYAPGVVTKEKNRANSLFVMIAVNFTAITAIHVPKKSTRQEGLFMKHGKKTINVPVAVKNSEKDIKI
jgi:hypothetical protein